MADRIKLLPDVVANQIAAGEVVNRPSSVVKEMMENAVDAGARTVTVNARGGGRELIQIVDDGCGMSPMDARMAFDRHATSKIERVEDIYALHTFGFRGEALASIAAVAQVELRTRQEGDEVGTRTFVNGGRFQSQEPMLCPVGSQFYVRNLFYNVPARRRFLEKSTASSKQIKAEFQRVALCNPGVTFELYDNDAPIYRLPPTSLAGRIVDVAGRHIKQNLLEVSADTSIVRIGGFVGRPAAAKKSNAEQYFFVNGRYFCDQYLRRAVLKAYEKLIPDTCFPSYFLFLEIDPERIDVNVHPQKTEVKFDDKEAVWEIVHAAVRNTLGKTGAVPMMDFTAEGRIDIPVAQRGAVYDEPAAMTNEHYNPFAEGYAEESGTVSGASGGAAPDEDFSDISAAGGDRPSAFGGRSGGCGGRAGAVRPDRRAVPFGSGGVSGAGAERMVSDLEGAYDEIPSGDVPFFPGSATAFANDGTRRAAAESGVHAGSAGADALPEGMTEIASSLGGAADPPVPTEGGELEYIVSEEAVQQRLLESPESEFRSVVPVAPGYAVALLGGVLVAVDLRRAQERLLYEYYLSVLSGGSAASQRLLFPERLELSHDEYGLLEQHAAEFAAIGFDIERLGDGAIDVKGTPADMPSESADELIYRLLQTFGHETAADVRRQRIASELAHDGARPMGRCTSREEIERLLERLQRADDRCYAPSGKPILAEITLDELRAKLR